MTFGVIIKTRRKSLDLSLRKVAKLCGVSPTYISHLENDIATPSEGVIYKLALVLDFDPDSLLIERAIIPAWARKYIFENWEEVKQSFKGKLV